MPPNLSVSLLLNDHRDILSPWTSPAHVTVAVLLVFVLSPLTIGCNALLVVAISRFKRLRNPSNYFLLALASADLGIGMLLPFGLYFEFSRPQIDCVLLCLFPYCILILICGVSILSVTAIALDRYTSLASPLRYNNIITHRSVGRYIAVFWIYALLLASSPILYWYYERHQTVTDQVNGTLCSFDLVLNQVRLFLLFSLFLPCALLVVLCYTYVYVVARYHAKAIFSVEVTFRQHGGGHEARYGRTLLLIVGLFLVSWMPFIVCMLVDTFRETNLLGGRSSFYLGVLALSSSALNPWLYGFRSSEFRYAFLRILEDLIPKLSNVLRKHRHHLRRHSTGGMTSCASHIRLCLSPNHASPCRAVSTARSTYLAPPDTIVGETGSPFLSPSSVMTVAEM